MFPNANMRIAAAEKFAAPPELHALAEEVFTALGEVRVALERSLLAFGGRSGLSSEILNQWVDSGLLRRAKVEFLPIEGATEPYLSLTRSGARALMHATGRQVHAMAPSRMRRSSQKRCHDLMVADFALAVMALARDGKIELAGIETDDKKLATSTVVMKPGKGPMRVALQADLYVVTRDDRGPSALLVEIDRGTISVAKMAERYAGYLDWQKERGPERDFAINAMRVLTVVPDEKRLSKLHGAALTANGGKRSGFLMFAVERDASTASLDSMLGPVARTLGSDVRFASILPPRSSGTPGFPGVRADRGSSPEARVKSQCRLGFPASLPNNRLPAVAASSQVPML